MDEERQAPTCGTCKHWRRDPLNIDPRGKKFGACSAVPPQLVVTPAIQGNQIVGERSLEFPVTPNDMSCGMHAPKLVTGNYGGLAG